MIFSEIYHMKTCHKFVLAVTLLFLADRAFAQTADTAKLNFIKARFAEISQNLKSYKKVEKTDTAETTDGNSVLLYYEGNEIRKITAAYYGESGKALHEFYFSGKKLIFCYFVIYYYNKPYYIKGGGKVASTADKRIYLDNDKIFFIKKRPAVSKNSDEFPDDPQKEAKRLINLK